MQIAHLQPILLPSQAQPLKDVNVSGVEKPVARFKLLDSGTVRVRECAANVVKFVCMCTTQNFHFHCVYRGSMWIYDNNTRQPYRYNV